MMKISERQFERVITNLNQHGVTVRLAGSGRSRISDEASDAIIQGLWSSIGKRSKHLSQREVAVNVGVSQSSVCREESDKNLNVTDVFVHRF